MKPPVTQNFKEKHTRLTASLLRWSFAFILLCGFGVLAAAPQVAIKLDSTGQPSLVATTDLALLAHGETLIAAKRINSIKKNQIDQNDLDQLWFALLIGQSDQHLTHVKIQLFSTVLPQLRRHNLEQLNTPRAPPFA